MPLKIDGALEQHPKAVYASDGWEIDLARRELRPRGALVPLGSRTFEIIEVLVQSSGELVDKYDLMGRVWPGAIVEENTLQFHISVARKAFGADRGLLKTVSGRGYRLLGHWTIQPANDEAELAENGPPRLSMVVLPFANIGGEPEQEHFVDGVTKSLTTDLSRIRGSFVIGRNTAFTYKGKPLDVKTIGRELNVRYVLEGSVKRGGNRMRVNVQLIDAESGNHLWAERFDKPLADLFDMQDEIVARLAGALNTELIAAEARRAEQAPNPNSMDLYFQGMACLNLGVTPDNVAQARSFFDRALETDPDNVDALIGSAGADAVQGLSLFVTDPMAALAAAEVKLIRALSSVKDHPRGHSFFGACRHIHQARGGRHRRMRTRVEAGSKSRRRPFHYWIWKDFDRPRRRHRGSHWRGPTPQSARYVGLYLDEFRGRGEAPPRPSRASGRVLSAVDRGQSKLSGSITWQLGAALSRSTQPTPSSRVRAARTAWSDDPTYLAQLEPMFEGLRKAGVREQ